MNRSGRNMFYAVPTASNLAVATQIMLTKASVVHGGTTPPATPRNLPSPES
jgi:hypothetical protein